MKIDEYVMRETLRQSGTLAEAVGMKNAVHGMNVFSFDDVEKAIRFIARQVKGTDLYRRTPVTFSDGGYSVPPSLIDTAMENLIGFITKYAARSGDFFTESDVDIICREFLNIHPFLDGNGRVASILRNWLLGTLDNPEPLPYYFGER